MRTPTVVVMVERGTRVMLGFGHRSQLCRHSQETSYSASTCLRWSSTARHFWSDERRREERNVACCTVRFVVP